MTRRVLMLNGGTMRGAFLVGALKAIDRLLKPDYFDTIFATSVGVFQQTAFASGQLKELERVWLEKVHGNQLINVFNVLRGREILDLDYLIEIIEKGEPQLNLKRMKDSKYRLFAFMAEYKTKKIELVDIKNGPIFDIMRATSALPIIYKRKININNQRYIDSWLASRKKFNTFFLDSTKDFDEVYVITSKKRKDRRFNGVKNLIRPSKVPMWGPFDTNKKRIQKMILQGESDMTKFIIDNNLKIDI